MEKYDVIIPVASKDTTFVAKTIKNINRNLEGVSHIYIITAKNNFKKLKHNISDNCILVNENTLTDELNYNLVHSYIHDISPKSVNRTGWYFQQFLKYAFALSPYCNTEYYLSWDADTLPLHHLSFFSSDGHPLFTKKNEYHKAYFNTIYKLLGVEKIVDYSFIAEHMLFNKNIILSLINEISKSDVAGESWVQKILNACDFIVDKNNLFSEFETYGTFCTQKFPGLYQIRQLNTFRGAGLIRGRYVNRFIIEKLSMDLDTASFEISHALFPWNMQYIVNKIISKLTYK